MWPERSLAPHDLVLTDYWVRLWPDAKLVRLDGAGQYLQEDAHERIVSELLDFLKETGAQTPEPEIP